MSGEVYEKEEWNLSKGLTSAEDCSHTFQKLLKLHFWMKSDF
jgi:hypothetical protein